MSLADDMYQNYLAAEAAILEGKTYKLGERLLGMEDLDKVRAGRQEWERRVQAEQAPRRPTFGGLSYGVARMDR